MAMSQHLVGLGEVAQFLGIVSRGKRPGNRLWELMRAGRLKQFPHVRIGRTYRFNMADVESWVRRQAGGGLNGLVRSR
jgi:predicted DNA-binding transcriptional regulator AlpA